MLQYTVIENVKSKTSNIDCGVPRDSVLGPLFFLLFINDLPNCCPTGKIRIFADDTNVFFHSNNIEDLITNAKRIMLQLNSWFVSNKLTLNTSKSSFTIFKSSRKKINNIPKSIDFLNYKIERKSSVKFLGVILDEHLTWNQHINHVCNKLRSLFHVFYSIRRYLSKDNIKTLYYTLVYTRDSQVTFINHLNCTELFHMNWSQSSAITWFHRLGRLLLIVGEPK